MKAESAFNPFCGPGCLISILRPVVRKVAAGLLACLTLAGAWAGAEEVSVEQMREALTVTAEVGTGLQSPSGRTVHAEVVGEDSYVTLGVGWGIQWHFAPSQFSKGIEYDVYVEFKTPAQLARQVNSVVFALYVFGQAEPEGNPNRVVIDRGGLKPDAWQTAKVARVRLDDKNGYFFADLHPRELIGKDLSLIHISEPTRPY